jgi:hypothetical protein
MKKCTLTGLVLPQQLNFPPHISDFSIRGEWQTKSCERCVNVVFMLLKLICKHVQQQKFSLFKSSAELTVSRKAISPLRRDIFSIFGNKNYFPVKNSSSYEKVPFKILLDSFPPFVTT